MDALRALKHLNINILSRIFRRRRRARTSESPQRKPTQVILPHEASRKPRLEFMDITLDVVFEIVRYLLPIDLLQLCRVSKPFRRTFMSQSARSLWVAARQNTDILPVPDPIPGMSEPHLATMLFEDSCLACGEEKREVRRRFSLCHDCAVHSMKKMCDMPKYDMFNGIPESVWSLVPATEDARPNWERSWPYQEYWSGAHFYAPEVQSVLDQCRGLAGPQADDEFIQMRLKYVASVAKSAKAISEWLSKCDPYETPKDYPYHTYAW